VGNLKLALIALFGVGYFVAFLVSFITPISCAASSLGVFYGLCWLASQLFGISGERYYLLLLALLFAALSLHWRR
jgi:hypothetical protein